MKNLYRYQTAAKSLLEQSMRVESRKAAAVQAFLAKNPGAKIIGDEIVLQEVAELDVAAWRKAHPEIAAVWAETDQ